MAAPAGGKQKHAVGISRNPPEPHMLRLAVSAGNTEYKHMVVSAGRITNAKSNRWDGAMDGWVDMPVDRWKWIGGFMDGWMGNNVCAFIFPQDGRQCVT